MCFQEIEKDLLGNGDGKKFRIREIGRNHLHNIVGWAPNLKL